MAYRCECKDEQVDGWKGCGIKYDANASERDSYGAKRNGDRLIMECCPLLKYLQGPPVNSVGRFNYYPGSEVRKAAKLAAADPNVIVGEYTCEAPWCNHEEKVTRQEVNSYQDHVGIDRLIFADCPSNELMLKHGYQPVAIVGNIAYYKGQDVDELDDKLESINAAFERAEQIGADKDDYGEEVPF